MPGDPPPSYHPLTFHWAPVKGVRRRFFFWLLVAGGACTGMFYLFRITPAAPPRRLPPEEAMLYLPAGADSTQRVFSSLNDRLPGVMPEDHDRHFAADSAALKKALPPWPQLTAPSFELKPINEPLFEQGLPHLPGIQFPALPPHRADEVAQPLPPPSPVSEEEVTASSPSVFCVTHLGDRTILQAPTWPREGFDDHESVPFMLGVTAAGAVTYCFPYATRQGVDVELIAKRLSQMRLSPAPEAVQWIRVDVRW